MSRKVEHVCDICRKPTERVVAKLHYIPIIPGVSKAVHSNYTHHAEVGVCCSTKILKVFNFTKRMTAEEYNHKRRARIA